MPGSVGVCPVVSAGRVGNLTGPGFVEGCLIGGGGGGGGGTFGAGVSGILSVKDELFFLDGAGVMAFSGFFSSETEEIGTLLLWTSVDLNEPTYDAFYFSSLHLSDFFHKLRMYEVHRTPTNVARAT